MYAYLGSKVINHADLMKLYAAIMAQNCNSLIIAKTTKLKYGPLMSSDMIDLI